jgi:hypothetical protein
VIFNSSEFFVLGKLKTKAYLNNSYSLYELKHNSETTTCDEASKFKMVSDRPFRRFCGVGIVMNSPGLNPSGFKIFLLFAVSSPSQGPTQPCIQWVLGALSLGAI